jgi:hypothetical protein
MRAAQAERLKIEQADRAKIQAEQVERFKIEQAGLLRAEQAERVRLEQAEHARAVSKLRVLLRGVNAHASFKVKEASIQHLSQWVSYLSKGLSWTVFENKLSAIVSEVCNCDSTILDTLYPYLYNAQYLHQDAEYLDEGDVICFLKGLVCSDEKLISLCSSNVASHHGFF